MEQVYLSHVMLLEQLINKAETVILTIIKQVYWHLELNIIQTVHLKNVQYLISISNLCSKGMICLNNVKNSSKGNYFILLININI